MRLLGNFPCMNRIAVLRVRVKGFSDECSDVKSLRSDYLSVEGEVKDKKILPKHFSKE